MKFLFHFFISNKRRAVLIAMLWTAFIFFACFIPAANVPKVAVPLIDKWVHFFIFAVCSFLWLCTIKNVDIRSGVKVFIIIAALGYVVELIQGSGLTKGRSYETNDVIADMIGSAIGVLTFFIWRKIADKKRESDSNKKMF